VQGTFDRLMALASGPTRHQNANVRSVPDLVEAAVRLGRADEVGASLELYARWAAVMRRPWIEALHARCLAMTETDAEPHFQRALALHDDKSRAFERARTELLYGEWLRRSRRRTDARAQLTSALQVFEELGAAPWAARARTELSAAGASVARAAVSDVLASLTPQELQISQLAAQGMSNNDIAAQLFLSPRTVAYHLYKAYPKLGITSRSELAALL
jgi:DNA-binding CsgD family transcriptional regulator